MENCLYCQIEDHITIFENDKFTAFLAPFPVNHGHIILTTKEHCNSLTLLSDEDYSEFHLIARKLARALIKTKEYDGFNLIHNHGECAGQESGHTSMHIIPRIGTDGFYLNWRQLPSQSKELNQALAKLIQAKL